MRSAAACCFVGIVFYFFAGLVEVQRAHQASETWKQTHLEFTDDLTGSGELFRIEFYGRGPLKSGDYIRGVAITRVGKHEPVLARREFEAGMSWFEPPTGLWPASPSPGKLIVAFLPYGARLMQLHVLQFDGQDIKEVGRWQGQDASLKRMAAHQQTVVVFTPSDLSELPKLYVWNGSEFTEASRRFPHFFAKLGAANAAGVENPQPLPPSALVGNCRAALRAFQLAGTPEIGRKTCTHARERIASGNGLIPGLTRASAEDFEIEKKIAVAEIDKLIEESDRNRSSTQ